MMKTKLFLTTTIFSLLLSGCSSVSVFNSDDEDVEEPETHSVYYIGEPYYVKGVLYTPKEDMNYSERGFATWYSRDSENRLTTNGEVFDDNALTAAHKTLPLPSLVRITNLENGNTAIVRVNDRGPAINNRLIDVSKRAAEALELSETGTTMVQVDILPSQSRRLKIGLEEYIEPKKEKNEETIPLGSDKPVYQPTGNAQEVIYDGKSKIETAPLAEIPVAKSKVQTKKLTKKLSKSPVENQGKIVPVSSGWYVQTGAYGNTANANRAIQTVKNISSVATKVDGNITTVLAGPFKSKAEAQDALSFIKNSGYADSFIKNIK